MSNSNLLYSSTRKGRESVPFIKAMELGLAPDGGLYLPEQWPDLSDTLWNQISDKSLQHIGRKIAQKFIPEMPAPKLNRLVGQALSFDTPLVQLSKSSYTLELFHGPTLAFKDVGARFMAQLMSYQARRNNQQMVILVATSGDTGSAVGRAFEGMEGVKVCLLYPSGKVSRLQEQQLTTIGGNVQALEVDGSFDDCQRLVKKAFSDAHLRDELTLSSANSINIARLLPQMFYYGRALAQLDAASTPHFCVPSGNFGNLTAGLMAEKTGMPVHKFVAATNVNDTVPQFLSSGKFSARPSTNTLSSAMDVGDPSNLERIRSIYPKLEILKDNLWAQSFDDSQTKRAIQKVYQQYGYTLDPHTAVGYLAAQKYRERQKTEAPIIVLGTAHPAKFADIVEPITGSEIQLPEVLEESLSRPKESTPMSASFEDFKPFLINNYT